MKKSQLRKLIKEEIKRILDLPIYKIDSNNFIIKKNKIKENKLSDKLYDEIFKNHYKEVEVSLRYAQGAGEVFRDSFKKQGKMTSTNVFRFKNEESTADFVESLIQDLNAPESEIELSE